MIQFYLPDITSNPVLGPTESAHCAKVLRLHEGDTIICTDGRGIRYTCRITDADRRGVKIEIESSEAVPRFWIPEITLAVAPTKNADRTEWLVEKAVEMGVDTIVPLITQRTQPSRTRHDRLQRIVESAMNQSLKTHLPVLTEPQRFPEFILSCSPADANLICYCDTDTPRIPIAAAITAVPERVNILIGPEGDFSPAEAQEAIKAGFQPITLTEARLRTETAAIYAVAQLHTILQILSSKQ